MRANKISEMRRVYFKQYLWYCRQ